MTRPSEDDADVTGATVSQTVRRLLVQVLDLDLGPDDLTEQTPLYSAVIRLDSLALLQLITELEKSFSCQVDDEAVMTADLVDVGSIVELMKSQLEAR